MYKLKMITLKNIKVMPMLYGYTYFIAGIIINFFQLLLYLLVKPISSTLYRRIHWYLFFSFNGLMVYAAEWLSNSTVDVWISEEDEKLAGKEHILLLMNHKYEIDWMIALAFSDHIGLLGNSKAFIKKTLTYIPIIGWGWKLAEFVSLERTFDKDKRIIEKQLNSLMSYPHPIFLIYYPEGTRFTEQKHESSVKFAQERGMPVLKHHLIPRTKGFTTSLPSLRNKCVIFDINLAFKKDSKFQPTLTNLLNGNPVHGYMYVRRIPLDDVPIEEGKAAEWLQQLFREKDKIQDSFETTGSFFTTSGFKEPKKITLRSRTHVLVNFIGWATLSASLTLYCTIKSLLTANWTGLSIILGILTASYITMKKTIGATEVRNASLYGAGSKKKCS